MRLKLVNDPKHWRERAEEMRTTAARITDRKVKAIMLGTAEGYDNVAKTIEGRMETKKFKMRHSLLRF
jgi:hypothetical protein